MNRWLALLLFLVVTFSAAAIGGAATMTSVGTWYQELAKPSWNPPRWIFSPVWTTLYVLMGMAAWRVWQHSANPARRGALTWFFVQLALNALCSVFFFGLRNPALALVEIVPLLGAIIVTGVNFWRIDRVAGLLFVPYVAWVSFATFLNATIWWLNR